MKVTDAQTCLCGRDQNSKCARENILKKCFASRSSNLRLFEFEFRLEVLTREKRQSVQSLGPHILSAENCGNAGNTCQEVGKFLSDRMSINKV